jgi:hypothetical protein
MTMTEKKQTLSPAEWKSVSDYLMELSERVDKAAFSSTETSPQLEGAKPMDHRDD